VRSTGKRLRRALAASVAVALLGGCAIGDDVRILPPVEDAVAVPSLEFDGSLEPSAAVLPLVPAGTTVLTVTDYEQVRLQMGLQDLTSEDRRPEREAFWTRAEAERPLLSTGMLRSIEPRLARQFGLTQMDVAWEAHFFDDAGEETGFVLAFRDGTDMTAVRNAVAAGFEALEGATVDPERGLALSGAADSGEESWAADADIRPLVGQPANSTYVSRACSDQTVGGELDDLTAYAVQFEGTLVTARLGEERRDLFDRMRAGSAVPEFAAAFDGGAADPLTGRIGYVMTDPVAAAALALADDLPFAACP
jgi:hypothetical protein